ncbi:MAG: SdpI family protein [bacterium]
MTPHTILLASAVLLIALAVPLWMRRVPPNRFYGVRTRAALADETRWYDVNARCGQDLLVAGVVLLVAIVVIDAIGARWAPELRTLASAMVLVVALVLVSVRSTRPPGRT